MCALSSLIQYNAVKSFMILKSSILLYCDNTACNTQIIKNMC